MLELSDTDTNTNTNTNTDTNTDTNILFLKLAGAAFWLLYICILVSKQRTSTNKEKDIENMINEETGFDDEEQTIRISSFRYILSVCRRRLLGMKLKSKSNSGSEPCNNVTVVDL